MPDIADPVALLLAVVGLGSVDQQTPVPFVFMVVPPLEDIVPPLTAPVPVMDVATVVVRTGRLGRLINEYSVP